MPDPASVTLALDVQLMVLAGIIWFAFTTEAATGFGGTLIAVTLGVRLYPIRVLLPLLVTLNLILSSYIIGRHHEHISGRLLLRQILPVMGVGLAVGLVLFEQASSETLKTIFGAFVVAVAVRELWSSLDRRTAGLRPLSGVVHTSGLLAAGVAHGLFACGGPLLVFVLGRSNLAKQSFRSTLASVWLTLNVALTAAYVLTGRMDRTALPFLALLTPAVFAGVLAGEWAHRQLDERRFRLAVLMLLVVAGLTILV